ncbi:MAG: glycosyltransferase [Candidatus Thermoplasmatota archaeon]|nr:glycosyltransferase [Candidatus Thermoplasmatota archaeon]
MEIFGVGFWTLLGVVLLLGYLFLIGIVCSIVYLDNVLPRIPTEVIGEKRVRAREISISSITGGLEPPLSGSSENFVQLIETLATKTTKGGTKQIGRLYNSGDFVGAISLAAGIVLSEPKNDEAMRMLARTLDRINERDRGLLVWDQMAVIFPMDEEIATRRVRTRYVNKEFEDCIEACHDLLESQFNDDLAFRMTAKSLMNLKRSEEALVIWEKLESISSDDEISLAIDRLLFSLERFDELHLRLLERDARSILEIDDLKLRSKVEARLQLDSQIDTLTQIARFTKESDDLYQVARVCFNKKRYDDVLKAVELLLQYFPNHAKGAELKVRTLIALDKFELALNELDIMNSKGILGGKLSLRRAEICYKTGDISGARMAFEKLWLENGDVPAAMGLIRCLIAEEEFHSAIDLIDSLDVVNNANVILTKLRCLLKMSKYSEVVSFYKTVQNIGEDDSRILQIVASAEKKLGHYSKAIELWEKVLELDPGNVNAEFGIAGASYDSHDNSLAMEYSEKVLERDPEHEGSLWLKSQIFIRQKEWVDAIDIIKNLYYRCPEDVRYWRSHIQVLYRLNRKEEAQNIFEKAIENIGLDSAGRIELILLAEEFLWSDSAKKMCTDMIQMSADVPETLVQLIEAYYSMGFAGSAARFARILRQRDEDVFQNSETVSRLLNLLEWADVSLNECGGDPFWGQWDEQVYTLELVAKAIVEKTANNRGFCTPLQRMAMVSSGIGRGGAERQMMYCLNCLSEDISIDFGVELYLHTNSSLDSEITYYDDLNKDSLTINTFGGRKDFDYLNHPLSSHLEPWIELISHIPDNNQIRRNLITMFYGFVKGNYDLIHAWQDLTNVITAMAALMAGVPRILLSARSLSPDSKTMLHMRASGFLKKSYIHLLTANRVVLCHNSEAGAESYRGWLGTDKYLFPVLHNGTAFEELSSTLDSEESQEMDSFNHWSQNKLIVGSVFRFVPEKRPLMWIDVANRLLQTRQDVGFLVVGDGPLFEEAKEKVEALGISQSFYFPGLTNAVGNWLEKMDLFLLTSSVEGLPNVVIEAQGFGVPVVSTNAGGAKEVIRPKETGFIVENDNVGDLANQLLWCLKEDEWRKNAGDMALGHSRTKFSVEEMYGRLLQLYDEF